MLNTAKFVNFRVLRFTRLDSYTKYVPDMTLIYVRQSRPCWQHWAGWRQEGHPAVKNLPDTPHEQIGAVGKMKLSFDDLLS